MGDAFSPNEIQHGFIFAVFIILICETERAKTMIYNNAFLSHLTWLRFDVYKILFIKCNRMHLSWTQNKQTKNGAQMEAFHVEIQLESSATFIPDESEPTINSY